MHFNGHIFQLFVAFFSSRPQYKIYLLGTIEPRTELSQTHEGVLLGRDGVLGGPQQPLVQVGDLVLCGWLAIGVLLHGRLEERIAVLPYRPNRYLGQGLSILEIFRQCPVQLIGHVGLLVGALRYQLYCGANHVVSDIVAGLNQNVPITNFFRITD